MSDYTVKWNQEEGGFLQYELSCDGEVIATGGGLQTEDEVKAWAREQAAAHDAELSPPPPLQGEETFTL